MTTEEIEAMPERERQRKAGQEIAALSPNQMTSVLAQLHIMRKWKVTSIIWPENMGSTLLQPRKAE